MVADHPDCPAPRVSPEEDRRRRAAVANTEAAPPKPKPQVAILAEQLAAAVEAHETARQSLAYHAAREQEASEKVRELALKFDEEVRTFRAEIAKP